VVNSSIVLHYYLKFQRVISTYIALLDMQAVWSIASGHSLHSLGRGSSQSRLLVPLSCKPLLCVLMAPRYRMASLLSCASFLGRFPTHSIIILKLLFLTVLELGAPLSSSGLEEVLEKFLNEWMTLALVNIWIKINSPWEFSLIYSKLSIQ